MGKYTRLLPETQNTVFAAPDRNLAQKSTGELIEVTVEYAASYSPIRSTQSLRFAAAQVTDERGAAIQLASLGNKKRRGKRAPQRCVRFAPLLADEAESWGRR